MSQSHPPQGSQQVLGVWREELAALGGQDTLLFFQERPEGTLDLGHAHPSGVAGFLAGRPTRLSSLFRESESLAQARKRARAVSIAGSRLTDEHALPGTHLAVGMAHWPSPPHGPQGVVAPVLLRPILLQPKGVGVSDHELDLRGQAWINPALLGVLARHGVNLDAQTLAGLATGVHGFTPRRVLERIAEQTAHLDGFTVTDRIVVGTFIDLAPGLLTSLENNEQELLAHPVVQALADSADNDDSVPAVPAQSTRNNPFSRDWDSPPEKTSSPATIFSLDEDQRQAVARAVHSDICVLAPPGTGATQVAAQMVVQAAQEGESLLVVAPRRGELRQLVDRLAQYGLHLLTDEGAQLATLPPQQPLPPLPSTLDRVWLHTLDEHWQVTPLYVLQVSAQEVTRRQQECQEPAASGLPQVRMAEPTLSRLVGVARERAAEVLSEGITSGAFRDSARETPWYGANVSTGDEVRQALQLVERLHDTQVPALIDVMRSIEKDLGLRPRDSVAGWLAHLELLAAVENTLAIFTPEVYVTELDEMIVATATTQWRSQHHSAISMMDRRRIRRVARELLQPGASPGDLHAALSRAHDEGRRWARVRSGEGNPRVPENLPEAETAIQQVMKGLDVLTQTLGDAPWLAGGPGFAEMPITDVQARLKDLKEASQALRSLPRQARLRAEAGELGLQEIVDQLAGATEVPQRVGPDLEVMWCAGVLRQMLAARKSAPSTDPPDLRFEAVTRYVAQAEQGTTPPPASLATSLAVPYRFSPADRVDRVLLLGAHRLGLAEAVLSVVHGKRLAVIGDPAGARPSGLELGDADQFQLPPRRSALDAAAAVLPTIPLRFTHRAPAELVDAAETMLGAGEGTAAAMPRWRVPAPWGQRRLVIERIADGRTTTSFIDGDAPVEAPDTEVRRVVDLVMAHAQTAQELQAMGEPAQTLGVVALTRGHARRIADHLRLRLRQRPEIAAWLLREGAESFVVTDIARVEDVTRDHVILSVGIGLTPQGTVLPYFGPLDDPDGPRMLRSALMRARQRVTVVTGLEAEHLDASVLTSPGAVGLRQLIELAGRRESEWDLSAGSRGPDPLLSLLVAGLEEQGATVHVAVNDGWPPAPEDADPAAGATRAPALPDLVVFPDPKSADPGPLAVIYDGRTPQSDPAAAVDRDARLAQTLGELGWRVVQVRALDLLMARKAVVRQVLSAEGA